MSLSVRKTLFEKGFNADTWLLVQKDERKLPTHRIVLSPASEFFNSVLKIKSEGEIEIILNKDFFPRFEVLEVVIRFLYINDLNVKTFKEFEEFFIAWKYLNPFEMRWDVLISVIEDLYDETNVLDFWNLIMIENPSAKVKDKLHKFAAENFMKIRCEPPFLNATKNVLVELLSVDSLNVTGAEEGVFQAIKKWINHDYAERHRHFPDLLKCLRFNSKLAWVTFLMESVWKCCDCVESKEILVEILLRLKEYPVENGQLNTTERIYI